LWKLLCSYKCLNTWKSNECLICRKKIYENQGTNESNESNEITNDSDNDILTILIDQHDRSLQCKQFCVNFCVIANLLGIGLYFLITNYQ